LPKSWLIAEAALAMLSDFSDLIVPMLQKRRKTAPPTSDLGFKWFPFDLPFAVSKF
jgi:hypothetical protein